MYKFEDAIKNKVHLVKEEKAKAKPRMDFYNFKLDLEILPSLIK